MIIKIIPETDEEKNIVQEVEHTKIKEFFIFGNKKDNDGDILDFHDWHGSYRFLLGSLAYFQDVISHERAQKESGDAPLRSMPRIIPGTGNQSPRMIKYGNQDLTLPPDNLVVPQRNGGIVYPDGTPIGEERPADQPEVMPEGSPQLHIVEDEMIADDGGDADEGKDNMEAMDDENEPKSRKRKTSKEDGE
jgi:hypothetical protein